MDTFLRSVSLLCWAHNEEALIRGFLERADDLLRAAVADYEILVVDDGSQDATAAIVREMAVGNPRIRLVQNDRNRNVGYSCKRAIALAGKEYLFWQTIDWSCDIGELRANLDYLAQYDIVAGTRWVHPGWRCPLGEPLGVVSLFFPGNLRLRSDSPAKAFVSVCYYALIRLLFRLPLSDYQNVAIFPTRLVKSLALESDSSFLSPETLLKLYWRGASFKEAPVRFIPRNKGKAKGTRLASILSSVREVFGCWRRWVVRGKRGRVVKGRVDVLASDAQGAPVGRGA